MNDPDPIPPGFDLSEWQSKPTPATAGDRGRGGMNARWGDQFVIAEPEPFPNRVTWRTHLLRPIWWLISRVIR